jgi:hypothetical protein
LLLITDASPVGTETSSVVAFPLIVVSARAKVGEEEVEEPKVLVPVLVVAKEIPSVLVSDLASTSRVGLSALCL